MLKKLFQLLTDSLAYGVSGLLGQLIGVLLLPLYTRQLGPSDYGVLAMLAFLPQVFLILAAAGIKSAVFQQFYRCDSGARRRLALSTAAASVLLSSLLILLVALSCSKLIARWLVGDEQTVNLVRLSLVAAAISTLTEIPLIALQALRRAKTVGLLNILQLIVVVSTTIYLVVVVQWGVLGVVLGTLVGACASFLISFAVVARNFTLGVDWQLWKEMARYSLPFLPHRLQGALMIFLGDYIIRSQLGLSEVGLYNMATRFALPIGFLSGAVQQAWSPYKFKVYAEDPNPGAFFRSIFTYYVFVLAYLWMGISVWGPEAIRLMTDPAFHQAAVLVWAVALMRSAQAFCPMLATGLELSNDTRLLPLVSFASLVTVIVASITLVPLFGAFGAAFATTLAWLTIAAGYFILAQRQVPVDYDWGSIISLCVMATVMVCFGQFVQSYALWLRLVVIITMSCSFPLLAMWILFRSTSERHRIEILTSRLFRRFLRQNHIVEDQGAEQVV